MERRTWEGKWKFYYELSAFEDCASSVYDSYDFYQAVGSVWDAHVYNSPTAECKPRDSPTLTMSWKNRINPHARSSFEFLRRDFLQNHGERICGDLMFLAGSGKYYAKNPRSIYRDAASWHEPIVTMRPAPIDKDVEDRFLRVCYHNQNAIITPAYHGTSRSNFKGIFEKGLLVPGESNGVHVKNGQANGPGVYTACLNNPMLSLDFCDSEACDTRTVQTRQCLSCRVDLRQSSQRCVNAGHDKSVFLSKLAVMPWGVLGDVEKACNLHRGSVPSVNTAIVDPAGLHYIKTGPAGAGGASGAIYKWLGIDRDSSFPEEVSEAIQCEGDVVLHFYGDKAVIHTVGPDLRLCSTFGHHQAICTLSVCYSNILAKFADQPNLTCLRLLPISGGIFSGALTHMMPDITVHALAAGFAQLNSEKRSRLLDAMTRIELCIYSDSFRHYVERVSSYTQDACRENVWECNCTSSIPAQVCSELLVCAVLDDGLDATCLSCSGNSHTPFEGSATAVKHVRDALVVADHAHVVPLFVASIASKPHKCPVPPWRANLCWHNRDHTLPRTRCAACTQLTWPEEAFDAFAFEDFCNLKKFCGSLRDKKKSKRAARRCSWRELRRSMLYGKGDNLQKQCVKQAKHVHSQHSWRQLQRSALRCKREGTQKQRTKQRSHEQWEKYVATTFNNLWNDSN
jgi:hypothetical protein